LLEARTGDYAEDATSNLFNHDESEAEKCSDRPVGTALRKTTSS